MSHKPKRIVLLGSTGSIGQQTLDVIESHEGSFEVVALAAKSDWRLLASQVEKFRPMRAVLADESGITDLENAVHSGAAALRCGEQEVNSLAALPDIDLVVNAIVGFAGFQATLAALSAGNSLALANKESLVAAGELITKIASETGAEIIPVDSEHSAIFQCLSAGGNGEIKRLLLTASGGPFLQRALDDFDSITPQEALKHPNWSMGSKISIDSATMMNKALEIIEAHWLFRVDPDRIEVVIHPQSIVHSMVEFVDSSVIAQMSQPDMRLPIRYALFHPARIKGNDGKINFSSMPNLTFFEPDERRYPALQIAYSALEMGGTAGAIVNAANETAVDAFLNNRIGFRMISEIVRQSIEYVEVKQHPNIDDIVESDRLAREYAAGILSNVS
jgi:1-deoxy-D-xylulose-5-phosphate reductoisomerase